MTFFARLLPARPRTADAESAGTTPATTGRRRPAGIAAGVAVAVLAGGTTAYGIAHKTVTLDVDGEITQVSTFAGSVDGVLADAGIELDSRDTVAPAASTSLGDGSQIVVRHARQVQVSVDGEETAVWTTALNADEALGALASRGGEVSLVASRSQGSGRAEIPVELDGPLEVLVDGQTHAVADGAGGLPAVLEGLGITLGDLDEVSVRRSDTGTVTVDIDRVVVEEVHDLHAIAFSVVEQPDPERLEGTSAVVTAGAEGRRTVVNRVTTVDGVETARQVLSDSVTTEPVTQVVAVGTKPKPEPVPAPSSAGSAPAAASASAGGLNWAALAQCESGGRVDAVSSTGNYHGLYQFSRSTWNAVGGAGVASQASAEEQTARAQALFDRAGAGQWPHCGPNLFR